MYSVQVTKGDVKVTGMAANLEDLAAVKKSLEDFFAGKVEVEKSETTTTAGTEISEKKPRKTKEKADGNSNSKEDDKEGNKEASNEVSSEEKISDKKVSKETSKKPKVSLAKGVAYDKANPTHKTLIGGFMDTEIPGWRSPKTIHKAKYASETLFAAGEDLLDREGEILDSFKQKFLALYNSAE